MQNPNFALRKITRFISMQKILANILFSTRLTAVLFIVFAAAMITGTFMDMHQETSPTPYTRELIYNAWWFETIMVIFVINFIGNIWRYRLYKKEKWATLVLHLAFILILIGAFITRYIGYEGQMSIREGESSNTFLSRENYVTAYIDGDYKINGVAQRLPKEWKVDFSPRLDNEIVKITWSESEFVTKSSASRYFPGYGRGGGFFYGIRDPSGCFRPGL